jgi:signal transduction histidine kinase
MSSPTQHVDSSYERNEPKQENQSFWQGLAGALLLAVVCAIFVFVISSAADMLMLREHETARLTIELSDGVSAIAIALLSYKLIRLNQDRRARLRQRVEIISDMNHHVRNALQVISLTSHGKDKEEITAIRESVNRIQWALRELLPKI